MSLAADLEGKILNLTLPSHKGEINKFLGKSAWLSQFTMCLNSTVETMKHISSDDNQ